MRTFLYKIVVFFLLISSFYSYSQKDTLISIDNNVLVGEIKSMEQGVLTMKTKYSDKDFLIEWLKVKKIISTTSFRIVLSNGSRFFGVLVMDTITDKVLIRDNEKGYQSVKIYDLVYFEKIDKGSIFDVLKLSMDFGYSYTKSNELSQLNGDIKASYNKQRWGASMFYNTVQNAQRDVSPTVRNNGGFGVKYFFNYGLFGAIDADYYSNNEQNMDLRSNYSFGVGKYILRTNQMYLNFFIGTAYSKEVYTDTVPTRKSYEAKVGLEFNIFDVGDLDLFTSAYLFPSFTENSRLRSVLKANVRYEFINDFYFKTGIDYNYDTKPIIGIDPEDFVFTAGIGWEL